MEPAFVAVKQALCVVAQELAKRNLGAMEIAQSVLKHALCAVALELLMNTIGVTETVRDAVKQYSSVTVEANI